MTVGGSGFNLTGFLIAALLVPIVGELIRQVGPVLLASRPEFDDLMDGLAFGVISGVAYATADTLVKNWGLLTGGYAGLTADAGTWMALMALGASSSRSSWARPPESPAPSSRAWATATTASRPAT